MTNEEILEVVNRYQTAQNVITGARTGSGYVIRDERQSVAHELWRGPREDPQAFLDQLRVERMRYALRAVDWRENPPRQQHNSGAG